MQAVDYDAPLSPAPDPDPPHGKNPRYWIDVTKIIHVPDGQLAPYSTKQIGPGLRYPFNDSSSNAAPPQPRSTTRWTWPTSRIRGQGAWGPDGSKELAPGYFTPGPNPYSPESSWPPPKQPVDIRDVIEVPEGALAPCGYVEYLPGWWAPDPLRGGPT